MVQGPAYDASCRDKIVVDRHGTQRVNIFHLPPHPPVTIDMKQVEPFKQFLAYLIPDKEQHDYFLDWLSCKAQHPEFRGAAMVMVAKAEGTGRGTLMQLIGKLFGQRNVRNITMDEMLSSQWTEWRASLFVHVDESMAMEDPAGARRAYDRLKELIDPMTTEGIVNVKYGGQMWVKMCSSMLLFSNHEDALYVADNTRRFYGVRNPDIPAPPAFFKKLREWMGDFSMPTQWERHVWAWLLERDVNVAAMTAPPPESEAMKKMKHASKSLLDAVIDGAIATWPSTIIPSSFVMDALSYYETKGLPKAWRMIAKSKLMQRLHSLQHLNGLEHGGRKFSNTLCANGGRHKAQSTRPMPGGDMTTVFIERDSALEAVKSFDRAAQRIAINQWLEENEYHF